MYSNTDNVTIYFLKDIVSRKKLYLTTKDVTTIYMLHYKNLTLKHVMEFVSDKHIVAQYLPDEVDLPKIPRQWIIDVCATVLGDNFREWVHDQVEERNHDMAIKKEMMISIDPQMAAKFQASTHVSCK